jgi:hypothetical protein
VRRISKVTEETNRARRQREARTQNPDRKPNQTPSQSPNRTPDQIDERRRRKENERIIRDQQARARGEAQVRRGTEAGPLSYSTEKRFGEGTPTYPYYSSHPRAITTFFDPVEPKKAPQSVPTPAESSVAIADRNDRARLKGIDRDRRNLEKKLRYLSGANEEESDAIRNRVADAMGRIDEITDRLTKGETAGVSADDERVTSQTINPSEPSREYGPTGSNAPSSYLDPSYRDVILEQSARYKPFVPKEPPAPAEPSEEMLKAAMNPSGRFTPTPYPLDPGRADYENELALRGMKAEDREKVEAQARSLQNQGLLYSAPMGLARFYVDPVVNELGYLGADISEVAGGLSRFGADVVAGIPDFIDRNFGDFIIDPRKNRFAQPAGLRPVRSPTMRSAPRNPLDPLSRLIEPMAEGASDPRSMYYFPGKFY